MVCGEPSLFESGLRVVDAKGKDVYPKGFRGRNGFPVDNYQGCGSERGIQRQQEKEQTVQKVVDKNSEPDQEREGKETERPENYQRD